MIADILFDQNQPQTVSKPLNFHFPHAHQNFRTTLNEFSLVYEPNECLTPIPNHSCSKNRTEQGKNYFSQA